MNDFQNFRWQPISSLPQLVAAMDGMLEETQEFHSTLGGGTRPGSSAGR